MMAGPAPSVGAGPAHVPPHFALIALAGDWRRQLRPLWRPAHLDFARPLLRVGRMHLFILLAVAVAGYAGTGLAFYWLTLFFFFFFFPWDVLAVRIENLFAGRAKA